jgi:hypothetical protein
VLDAPILVLPTMLMLDLELNVATVVNERDKPEHYSIIFKELSAVYIA